MQEAERDRLVRAAQNQSLFRAINERLQGLADGFQWIAEGGSFACECADVHCVDQMHLTVDEYEALRSHPNRFAVLHGHVRHDVERVVDETARFVVVEKLGEGAKVARHHDPRRRDEVDS